MDCTHPEEPCDGLIVDVAVLTEVSDTPKPSAKARSLIREVSDYAHRLTRNEKNKISLKGLARQTVAIATAVVQSKLSNVITG